MPTAAADAAFLALTTGVPGLDLALGGGWARGRVVEVFGRKDSGKTTLLLTAIAAAQREGKTCAFIDAEHRFDVAYATGLGVDVDRLLVAQPDSGEQALDIANELCRCGAVDLIVIDAVAGLRSEHAADGEWTAVDQLTARLMSQGLRKLTAVTARTGTCVMFANQVIQREGVTYGVGEVTSGGNALKFYSTMRVELRRTEERVQIKVVKNKLAPPFQTVAALLTRGIWSAPVVEAE